MTTNPEIIYQQRFYIDEHYGWTDWKQTSGGELEDIREYINWGKRYQIRELTQTSLEGYQLPEPVLKVCPNKVNGSCTLHNLFCTYPDCENE